MPADPAIASIISFAVTDNLFSFSWVLCRLGYKVRNQFFFAPYPTLILFVFFKFHCSFQFISVLNFQFISVLIFQFIFVPDVYFASVPCICFVSALF